MVRLVLPPGSGKQVEVLGDGPDAAPAVVAVLARAGARLTMVPRVRRERRTTSSRQQALAFARWRSGERRREAVDGRAADVRAARRVGASRLRRACVERARGRRRVIGAGHRARQRACSRTSPPGSTSRWRPTASRPRSASRRRVTRVRWGGSLLEEARVHGSPLLLTVAPHAVAARAARRSRSSSCTPRSPTTDLRVAPSESARPRRRASRSPTRASSSRAAAASARPRGSR